MASEGKHPFQNKENHKKAVAASLITQKQLLKEGKHNFQQGFQKPNALRRVAQGTHHFCGPNLNVQRLKAGTHPSQVIWVCPHCGKSGKGNGNYIRYHGNRCKSLKT